jgi:hypothetical protein
MVSSGRLHCHEVCMDRHCDFTDKYSTVLYWRTCECMTDDVQYCTVLYCIDTVIASVSTIQLTVLINHHGTVALIS